MEGVWGEREGVGWEGKGGGVGNQDVTVDITMVEVVGNRENYTSGSLLIVRACGNNSSPMRRFPSFYNQPTTIRAAISAHSVTYPG